jgi:hypothetical protein
MGGYSYSWNLAVRYQGSGVRKKELEADEFIILLENEEVLQHLFQLINLIDILP